VSWDKSDVIGRLNKREFFGEYVALPQNNKNEVVVICPFHDDRNPSLSINLVSGQWNCHGCDAKGDAFTWLEMFDKISFPQALERLAARVGMKDGIPRAPGAQKQIEEMKPPVAETVPPEIVAGYVKTLQAKPALVEWLGEHRGISTETIEGYQIGFCDIRKRYTLPVKDSAGNVVNVRMYRPNAADGDAKMESWKAGYGTVRLYPFDDVIGPEVILCEGEWDCLIARQNGFNCYTTTGGADTFPASSAKLFAGKNVTICYDLDDAGERGAKHTAQLIHGQAARVRIATLPLNNPKADISDFFVMHKLSAADLQKILDGAQEYLNGKKVGGPKAFRDLVPDGSFLHYYSIMAGEMTDAPVEFHLAVGLSVLSAAVGNNVFFRAWGRDVYPNLWTILLAPSGFYRKTTAMNIGLRIIKAACRERMLPNDFTQEKLMENLSKESAGIVPVIEFGAFLKSLSRDYNVSLKEFLTEVYDGGDYRRETKGGTIEITNPAVSIMAGTTIDWIVSQTKGDDLKSGFFARFLFWPGREKNGWKGLGDQQEDPMFWTCVELVRQVAEVKGQVVVTPEILETYNKWLRKFETGVNEEHLPGMLQGFLTRLGTYVLKFAVLYQLSMTQELGISPEAMYYATRLADYLKSHLVRLMEDEMVISRDGQELNAIAEIIGAEPGLSKSAILRKSKMKARNLNDLLDTLFQSERIRAETEKTASKPIVRYYLREDQ
jgi:hypothetical protein